MITFVEREESGRVRRGTVTPSGVALSKDEGLSTSDSKRVPLLKLLRDVFLPAGYPDSVSPDYLRYQVFNALQAFCSSLAGLIASRAILEGFGVGDPLASANHALLLTVLQDVFSRLSTIFGAYYLGTLLVPEAKTYRLLADVLNDAAIALDTLSPLLNTVSAALFSETPSSRVSGLRVAALCTSGALRALCGVAAGGAKAALTVHFATPLSGKGKGDLGDLNAKDGSKETVLALLGMLVGSLVVPLLTRPETTYGALFVLLSAHLLFNYIGINGVVLRSLNRQRLGLAWAEFRKYRIAGGENKLRIQTKDISTSGHARLRAALTPYAISCRERVFARPSILIDPLPNRSLRSKCILGESLASLQSYCFVPPSVLESFLSASEAEMDMAKYVLIHDWHAQTFRVCFKEGYTDEDTLRAWVYAIEASRAFALLQSEGVFRDDGQRSIAAVKDGRKVMVGYWSEFVGVLREAGWDLDGSVVLVGSPRGVLLDVHSGSMDTDTETKKGV